MVKTCTDEKSIRIPRSPANEGYRPKPFAGRGILVKGSQCHQYVDTDPSGTSGWGLICKGGVQITHVPFLTGISLRSAMSACLPKEPNSL